MYTSRLFWFEHDCRRINGNSAIVVKEGVSKNLNYCDGVLVVVMPKAGFMAVSPLLHVFFRDRAFERSDFNYRAQHETDTPKISSARRSTLWIWYGYTRWP